MFLEVTARLPVLDISVDAGFISKFDIRIVLSAEPDEFEKAGLPVPDETDDEGLAVAEVGTASIERLHLDLIDRYESSIFDACDADSADWEAVFSAFLTNGESGRGYYQEIDQTVDCVTGDVLLITEIALKAEYRGRRIELGVAKRLIDTLGSGCDLAVYFFGAHVDELKALEPTFEEGPVKGYAYVNLLCLHAIPIEDGFARFKVLESSPAQARPEYDA